MKNAEYMKSYYVENKKKRLEYQQQYNSQNKEKIKQYQRDYHLKRKNQKQPSSKKECKICQKFLTVNYYDFHMFKFHS